MSESWKIEAEAFTLLEEFLIVLVERYGATRSQAETALLNAALDAWRMAPEVEP